MTPRFEVYTVGSDHWCEPEFRARFHTLDGAATTAAEFVVREDHDVSYAYVLVPGVPPVVSQEFGCDPRRDYKCPACRISPPDGVDCACFSRPRLGAPQHPSDMPDRIWVRLTDQSPPRLRVANVAEPDNLPAIQPGWTEYVRTALTKDDEHYLACVRCGEVYPTNSLVLEDGCVCGCYSLVQVRDVSEASALSASEGAMSETMTVLDRVKQERERQVEAWDEMHDDSHLPGDWTRQIVRYLGRAEQAIEDGDFEAWERRMTQVAALAVAGIEAKRRQASALTEHGMVPGSHERPGGPECRCGAAWSSWDGRCAASTEPGARER